MSRSEVEAVGVRVVYFAPDLADAAVARRVRMIHAGGATVQLVGFRRSVEAVSTVEGVGALDLGQVCDGKLAARAVLVLRRSLVARHTLGTLVARADVLLARNLDMVTIADAARAGSSVRLVYECLDVHSALLRKGVVARLLRTWERRILRRCNALVVSSPGFIRHYFTTLASNLPPVIVAENKQVLRQSRPGLQDNLTAGSPWRIGWFGILRCIKSFYILRGLAQSHPNLIDVEMRGRPTAEFQAVLAANPPLRNMRFNGPYCQDELPEMYNNRHFNWTIDYFQEGQNSDWLLPNRLYEGGFYNCPPIARAGTETAAWLQAEGTGVVLPSGSGSDLRAFFSRLDAIQYYELRRSASAVPTHRLIDTVQDCHRFVKHIMNSDRNPEAPPKVVTYSPNSDGTIL